MLTAALSTIWGLGLMGHTGLVIDAWNVATPILLIAIAAGHSAQMLKRYIEEVERLGDNRAAVISSTASMGPVMIAAGGVAALGLRRAGADRHPGDRRLRPGLRLRHRQRRLLEMTFVPALRSLLPAPRATHAARRRHRSACSTCSSARILDRGGRAGADRRRRSRWLFAAARRGADPHLRLDQRVPGARQPAARAPRQIERHFPGTVTMTVLYEGPPESAKSLAELQHIDGLRAELERDPLVWRTASLVDLIKIAAQDLQRRRSRSLPPARQPGAALAAHVPRQLAGVRALHRPRVRALAARRLPARRRLGARRAAGRPRARLGRRPSAAGRRRRC